MASSTVPPGPRAPPGPGPPSGPGPPPGPDASSGARPKCPLSSPSWHSTTIMPGPRLAASASVGRRRDTTVRSRRGNTTSGRIVSPRAPNQFSSSRWYDAKPSRQDPSGPRRRPHSTVPPPRSSRKRRAAMPTAAKTRMIRKAANSQAASSASAPPTETLGLVVACGPQERPRVLGLGRLLGTRTGLGQRGVEFAPRLLPVDFLGEASLGGQDRYPVVGHGQEPAADRGAHRVGVVVEDLDQA